jgi:hypothetical protein
MTQSIGAGLKKVQNGTEWHPLVQYQKQPRWRKTRWRSDVIW